MVLARFLPSYSVVQQDGKEPPAPGEAGEENLSLPTSSSCSGGLHVFPVWGRE